jgi:hypothetical protein
MGQFDSPSEASLARIKSEQLSSSPVAGKVEKAVTLGGLILEAAGLNGASAGAKLYSILTSLAGTKDESNFIYVTDAIVEDIRNLYRMYDQLKDNLGKTRTDQILTSPEFLSAVQNSTLFITRTNVEARLKGIAHIITNGVRENDLEHEALDDMFRAAVELKNSDIILLRKLYESQNPMLGWLQKGEGPQKWHGDIQQAWQKFINSGSLNPQQHLNYRSSFARLESLGLIQQVREAGQYGVGYDIYGLLMEGKKFYERLQEITIEDPGRVPHL